jgi:LPS-assembly protein
MDPAETQPREGRARRRARIAAVLVAALWCALAGFFPPLAQGLDIGGPGSRLAPLDPQEPWQIEADRITYDQVRDEYLAEGDVVITRQDRSIKADTVRYNLQTMTAMAEGHVVVTAGADTVSGDFMQLDLVSEQGFLDDGAIFIQENNYHIRGERIQKVGAETYHMDRGYLTTCDGPNPDWKIAGRDVSVKEDGSGSAWHATLYAREVPVAYFPYLRFPARGRQTGFLMPQFGYYKKKGASYNQPFFWAIDESSDATFYMQYMSNRGWKPGVEYRYYLTREAKGAFMLDYLFDDKIDDGSRGASDDYGYSDNGGTFLRPHHERYWMRMSHYNPLPWGFEGRLDLDILSDQDYLQDFKSGYMGFEDTSAYFNKFFGRTFDDFNDPVRVNRLLLSRSWSQGSLNAEARMYDDVRAGQNRKETIQKLPVVRFDTPKQRIAQSPLFYNVGTEYTHFWQVRGSRVQRIDLYPRAYYPMSLSPYLTLEPSVGLRETVWNQYEADPADPWAEDRYFHRELYDTRLSLFTDFFRVYDAGWQGVERVKHAIRPEITHSYIPEVDQDRLPNIDSGDRIENRNRIAYSVTNTFTAKSAARTGEPEDHTRKNRERGVIESPSDYDYRDFLRVKVSQYYEIADHQEPFSPVKGRVELFPGGKISLDTEARYDVHDTQVVGYNVALTLRAREKDRLFVEYRYDREPEEVDDDKGSEIIAFDTPGTQKKINSLFAELRLGLTDRLGLLATYDYSFEENAMDGYGIGFSYQAQCWTVEALYRQGSEDAGIGIRIRLHGIGEFGL